MKYRINSPRRMTLELSLREWISRVIGRYHIARMPAYRGDKLVKPSIISAVRFALPERWRD